MWPVRHRAAWVAAIVAVLVVAGGVGWYYFAPKGARHLDDALPLEPGAYRTLADAEWEGADAFHHARGALRLLEGPSGERLLRFEAYEARDGPAVYFYLVEDAGDVSAAAVEERGLRLSAANLRGNFHLDVPQDADLSRYSAVVAWCDHFDTLFGTAPLRSPP